MCIYFYLVQYAPYSSACSVIHDRWIAESSATGFQPAIRIYCQVYTPPSQTLSDFSLQSSLKSESDSSFIDSAATSPLYSFSDGTDESATIVEEYILENISLYIGERIPLYTIFFCYLVTLQF